MKGKEEEVQEEGNVFAGWEEPSDIDFFGTESPVEKPTEEKEEESKEDESEESKIEDIDFFEDNPDTEKVEDLEDEEDEVVKKPAASKADKVSASMSTLEYLKDKGLVEYELEEGQELTDKVAEELLESSLEEQLEEKVVELLSDLPDNVKDIVNYAKDGGDVNTLLAEMMKNNTIGITKDTDMTSVGNQEAVMKQEYKDLGYDADFIESQLEALKDSGKLEKVSKGIFEKKIGKQDIALKAQAEQQKANRANAIAKQKEYKAGLSDYLGENKNVKAFKISRKDKTELPGYISDKSVKLDNGSVVSPLQRDLFAALQDQEKTLMIAKILKSDFDFSSLDRDAQTKATTKVKRSLESSDKLTPKDAARSSRKSIADYF